MDEIERRLLNYRPAEPPPDLRQRVIDDAGRGAVAAREWLPAVAAVLVATIFYWLAAGERGRIAAHFADADAAESAGEVWP